MSKGLKNWNQSTYIGIVNDLAGPKVCGIIERTKGKTVRRCKEKSKQLQESWWENLSNYANLHHCHCGDWNKSSKWYPPTLQFNHHSFITHVQTKMSLWKSFNSFWNIIQGQKVFCWASITQLWLLLFAKKASIISSSFSLHEWVLSRIGYWAAGEKEPISIGIVVRNTWWWGASLHFV